MIRDLNRRFRRKNKATDVLSFPAAEAFGKAAQIAGDLAISLETAARQAEAFGHPLETEVKVLILHGILHLAGMDHEADTGEMARRESALRKRFELPAGLIQRSGRRAEAPAKKISPRSRRGGEAERQTMTLIAMILIVVLLFILTLGSYVDRMYSEMGKFLSREFQENIDAWEQLVEPRLGMDPERISLSAAVLTQMALACITLLFGAMLFDRGTAMDRPSAGEVGQAVLGVVLVVVIFNRLLPFVFFTRTRGLWISKYRVTSARAFLPGDAGNAAAGFLAFDCRSGGAARAELRTRAPPKRWTR